MVTTKKRLSILSVLLTALPLMAAGVDNILQSNHLVGVVFILAATANLIILIYAVRMDKPIPAAFEILSAIVLLVVAVDYHLQGKKYLPYAYLLAGLMSVLLPALARRRARKEESA